MNLQVIPVDCEPNKPVQLGITVVPSSDRSVGGLEITKIMQGSQIDNNGRFQPHDIIVKVNDFSLENMPFKEAQTLLKEQLKLRHSQNVPLVLSIIRPPTVRNDDFVGALNTRMIGIKHRIQLTKGPEGLGFTVAARDNRSRASYPIKIKTINPRGAAIKDGRLKPGDTLLEVNGIDLVEKSQDEVANILWSIKTNETADIIISRLEKTQSEVDELEQSESLVLDIPLNDTRSAGLGIQIKGPKLDNNDLGIWVDKIITGGAAWKDGRLQPNDQITAIDGLSLIGFTNAEAKEKLTSAAVQGTGPDATANVIRLSILRRKKPTSLVAQKENDSSDFCSIGGSYDSNLGDNNLSLPQNNKESPNNTHQKSNETQDSFRTASNETVIRNSPISDDGSLSQSSLLTPNRSSLSPITQASNSMKNSETYKSEQNSSGKTNDTSYAVSPDTEVTNVTQSQGTLSALTAPKTMDVISNHNSNASASLQSLDEDLTEGDTAESFQRDGFGRQSMSEKRHAQLNAKSTDTYRRRSRAKEEREKEEQLRQESERQKLIQQANNNRRSLNLSKQHHHRVPSSNSAMNSIALTLPKHYRQYSQQSSNYNYSNELRELPVDVHIPIEPGIEVEPLEGNSLQVEPSHSSSNFQLRSDMHTPLEFKDQARLNQNHARHGSGDDTKGPKYLFSPAWCFKCRSPGSCPHHHRPDEMADRLLNEKQRATGGLRVRKSNSLESLNQSNYAHQGSALIVPGCGTVRVARNRKTNDSTRITVEESYKENQPYIRRTMNSSNQEHHDDNSFVSRRRELHLRTGNSFGPSIASTQYTNVTETTTHDERALIKRESDIASNSSGSKKSSSLFRFFKLGSRKEKKKKDTSNESELSKTLGRKRSSSLDSKRESVQARRENMISSENDTAVGDSMKDVPMDQRILARQAAQREQERINEHFIKFTQQHQQPPINGHLEQPQQQNQTKPQGRFILQRPHEGHHYLNGGNLILTRPQQYHHYANHHQQQQQQQQQQQVSNLHELGPSRLNQLYSQTQMMVHHHNLHVRPRLQAGPGGPMSMMHGYNQQIEPQPSSLIRHPSVVGYPPRHSSTSMQPGAQIIHHPNHQADIRQLATDGNSIMPTGHYIPINGHHQSQLQHINASQNIYGPVNNHHSFNQVAHPFIDSSIPVMSNHPTTRQQGNQQMEQHGHSQLRVLPAATNSVLAGQMLVQPQHNSPNNYPVKENHFYINTQNTFNNSQHMRHSSRQSDVYDLGRQISQLAGLGTDRVAPAYDAFHNASNGISSMQRFGPIH